ncbi:hypothetical protein [Nocardia sp. CS682]|uniref:hypothetical protein n=1 Tax=Nocardia sp. CS682 TaxID=1047172 RepID=UPI0010750435|nr:hypothetical protein [Nocardia sp. CS682]QBS46188.1 hypothetical protein DMB37_25370 [Nocardia sp. CS682]
MDIVESASEFRFVLEAVLAPEHPHYHPPAAGDQYCYADGDLVFSEVRGVEWVDRSFQKYKDATGTMDLGNIDSLTRSDGVYTAIGDWGRVQIHSSAEPEFRISETD